MTADRDAELTRLIGAMCDGTITADEAAQLDSRLTHDVAARHFYNNYLFLHGELYSQHAAATCRAPQVRKSGFRGRVVGDAAKSLARLVGDRGCRGRRIGR